MAASFVQLRGRVESAQALHGGAQTYECRDYRPLPASIGCVGDTGSENR